MIARIQKVKAKVKTRGEARSRDPASSVFSGIPEEEDLKK